MHPFDMRLARCLHRQHSTQKAQARHGGGTGRETTQGACTHCYHKDKTQFGFTCLPGSMTSLGNISPDPELVYTQNNLPPISPKPIYKLGLCGIPPASGLSLMVPAGKILHLRARLRGSLLQGRLSKFSLLGSTTTPELSHKESFFPFKSFPPRNTPSVPGWAAWAGLLEQEQRLG